MTISVKFITLKLKLIIILSVPEYNNLSRLSLLKELEHTTASILK